jgi:hypothetical protein
MKRCFFKGERQRLAGSVTHLAGRIFNERLGDADSQRRIFWKIYRNAL